MAIDLTTDIDITSVNNTAKKYKKEIQTLDMLDAFEMLKHFVMITGVQDSFVLTHMIPGARNSRGYDGEFKGDKTIATLKPRTLTVHPIVYDLKEEPEKLRRTFIAEIRGNMDQPEAFYKWLIQWCIARASEELYDVLPIAVRNELTAKDDILNAFNGLEKIIADAITDGEISDANGNYYDPGVEFTSSNIGALLLEMWRKAPATFRRKGGKMMIGDTLGDMYDDWYKAEHDAPPSVDTAGQLFLDGSNKKVELVRQSNIINQRVILFRAGNLVYGVDKISDMSSLKPFVSGNPHMFTAVMKYVFGMEIVTVDKSMFITNKLYESSGSGSGA